ncbi:MAG: VOC family protein [Paracoccaceae bacterium]
MKISHIDHVQLAMPKGEEARAAAFYSDALGLRAVEKPPLMRASGGVWFMNDGVNIHLGIDPDFRPAKKAHPALRVDDLDALATRLKVGGFRVEWDERMPGTKRFYSDDPYGNRLEFMALVPN